MRKRMISLMAAICVIICLSVGLSASAFEVSETLEVGHSYPETVIKTITAESENIEPISPAVQMENGITFSFKTSGKVITLTYRGTPEAARTVTFDASYRDNGTPVEGKVTFAVAESSPAAEKPVINSFSPSSIPSSVKQSDSAIQFSVSASANGTLSYEWLLDGVVKSTASSYTFEPSSVLEGTHYLECVVTNTRNGSSANSGDSSPSWEFRVEKAEESEPPKITGAASAAEISGTGTAKLKVTAEGENLTYQWYMVTNSGNERVVDGKYGAVEYSGGKTDTLKITCTMAPNTVTTKFMCEVTDKNGLTAKTEDYILYVKEDPEASRVKSISVSKKPSKTTYVEGETLDTSGMEVTVVTAKGTETITSDFVCSPTYLDKEGSQTITVSYGGQTATFSVSVSRASHEHSWSDWQVDDGRVYRSCTVSGCTAKEIFVKDDFIDKYPTQAASLGLEKDEEDEPVTAPEEEENSA